MIAIPLQLSERILRLLVLAAMFFELFVLAYLEINTLLKYCAPWLISLSEA